MTSRRISTAVLLVCLTQEARAACQEESAVGAFQVGGIEPFFVDDDLDGLPESYRCALGAPSVDIPSPAGTVTPEGWYVEPMACGVFALVVGTPGDDDIDVSTRPVPVLVFGGAGADELIGGPFDDLLHGSYGTDTLRGGAGNDRLCLHKGLETEDAYGGSGDDYLFGGFGRDRLHGGPGNDVLQGAPGDDALFGGPGDDALYGAFGDDVLFGGEGVDQLHGGDGQDRLFGGTDADLIYAGDRDVDVIGSSLVGGPAIDECRVDIGLDVHPACAVSLDIPTCGRRLFAARMTTAGAELWNLDADDGAALTSAVTVVSDDVVIDVRALTVTADCALLGVVETPAEVQLVDIDPTTGIAVPIAGPFPSLRAITSGLETHLYGLVDTPSGAALARIDGNVLTPLTPVGRGGVAHSLVLDAPEGFLFAVTERGGSYDYDVIEPYTTTTSYAATVVHTAPMTWDSERNLMLEVDPDGWMYERHRRWAERGDQVALAHDVDQTGAIVPITDIVAIAMAHFD